MIRQALLTSPLTTVCRLTTYWPAQAAWMPVGRSSSRAHGCERNCWGRVFNTWGQTVPRRAATNWHYRYWWTNTCKACFSGWVLRPGRRWPRRDRSLWARLGSAPTGGAGLASSRWPLSRAPCASLGPPLLRGKLPVSQPGCTFLSDLRLFLYLYASCTPILYA